MRHKRDNYIISEFVTDYMFELGPLLMLAGNLIETYEVVCWWDLGLLLRIIFFELESVKPIYRHISQRIDEPWAADDFFWISANMDHR